MKSAAQINEALDILEQRLSSIENLLSDIQRYHHAQIVAQAKAQTASIEHQSCLKRYTDVAASRSKSSR